MVTKCLAHKHNTLTHLWLEAGSCDQKFDTHHKSTVNLTQNKIQSIVPSKGMTLATRNFCLVSVGLSGTRLSLCDAEPE